MTISESGNTILQSMENLKHFGATLLNKGLTEVHVRDVARMYEIDMPESLIELYRWRNGTNMRVHVDKVLRMGDVCFFPGYVFFSIEDAINAWNVYRKKNDWNKWWFPIFGNTAGCLYVVNCQRESDDFGKVLEYGDVYFDPDILFSSLEKMLETLAKAYQVGAFFQGDLGLESDDQIYLALAKDMNPETVYWETVNP